MTPPTNLLDLAKAVLARAEDDAFLTAMRADPGKAIREHLGVTFAPTDVIADDDLDHVVGGTNIGGLAAMGTVNLQGMDLESAMMAVQANRANLLESQLKAQLEAVQAKNELIADLNGVLGEFNKIDAATEQTWSAADNTALDKWLVEHKAQLDEAGLTNLYDQARQAGDVNGAELQQNLKNQIDSLSNSQQMDMLRLQSLSNKRNEAFDLMTNFIKKVQENRSSIIGNMR